MVVFLSDMDITLKSVPNEIFWALFVEGDTLVPLVKRCLVERVRNIEGNGGSGTLKVVTLGTDLQNNHVTLKINDIDRESFTYKCTITEGYGINDRVGSISFDVKIVAFNEGSRFQDTTTYTTNGHYRIPEDVINSCNVMITEIVQAIDNHISEHPN